MKVYYSLLKEHFWWRLSQRVVAQVREVAAVHGVSLVGAELSFKPWPHSLFEEGQEHLEIELVLKGGGKSQRKFKPADDRSDDEGKIEHKAEREAKYLVTHALLDQERNRQPHDKELQRRILADLDRERRENPQRYKLISQIDVSSICAELGVTKEDYFANAQRLLEQGKINEFVIEQMTIAEGYAYITEAGVRALESAVTATTPQRSAQDAAEEMARLRRRLQIAERDIPSLIRDENLRRRCESMLADEGDYDRVFREACVVLEDRVRGAIGEQGRGLVGAPLMARAFNPDTDLLRLSDHNGEQKGAMHLYQGVMLYFRNAVGHRLIDTYSQEEALRFVAFVDLLLELVSRAEAEGQLTE